MLTTVFIPSEAHVQSLAPRTTSSDLKDVLDNIVQDILQMLPARCPVLTWCRYHPAGTVYSVRISEHGARSEWKGL